MRHSRHQTARRNLDNSRRRHRPLRVEQLEDRRLLAGNPTISIGDATALEQGNLSTFVAANPAHLQNPLGMAFGPDRNGDSRSDLYVVGGGSYGSNNIAVYDGDTGGFVEQYVPPGAGLIAPGWITFDRYGNLYTSISPLGGARTTIVRVDHATQAVNTFVPANSGGLLNAKGLAFGPDGHLYVADASSHQVLRFDGSTGAPDPLGAFVDSTQGLVSPGDVVFGPDRTGDQYPDLYVSSNLSDQVLMFDGAHPNTPLGVLVQAGSGGGFTGPHDMEFGPDGSLYVVYGNNTTLSHALEQVFRFDSNTGALIDVPVAAGSGLDGPTSFLTFNDRGEMLVSASRADEVLRYSVGPLVTLSEPSNSIVTVAFSTAGGSATSGVDYSPVSGRLTFLPGETSKRILITPFEDVILEGPEFSTVNLSDPTGAVIVDGQGVVTIDNRQTKFFVVDDFPLQDVDGQPWRDKTFKYDSGGTSIVANEIYQGGALNVRGVESNPAGTELWAIDAVGAVYVTDNRNYPLGIWTAAGLSQPEGIATNGTHIWIVDAGADRVYKYAGAAALRDGTQNATSSFKLSTSKGNTNPKGIVTDGTYLYVVNDGATDKVFKYTLTGSLKGSWTISTSGAATPTGITLDPANPAHLWIVDAGTDRVYQYNNAVTRTKGSQSASTSFALAAGNINPQGIADPPPVGSLSASSLAGSGPENSASDAAATALFVPVIPPSRFMASGDASELHRRLSTNRARVQTAAADHVMSQWDNLPAATQFSGARFRPDTRSLRGQADTDSLALESSSRELEIADDVLENALDLMLR